MQSEEQVAKIISTIAEDMTGFIAASLVDLESGMTLGMYSERPDFDLTAASAFNSELVKQKQKIMNVLGLASTLDDITLTLSDQIHIIRLITPGTFLYLAADRSATNLAIVRSAINRHAAELV